MAPLDDSQVGPAIERAGYKYVNGSGYGPSALWVSGKWNGDTFTPDADPKTGGTFTQEQLANQLFPSSSPYLPGNNKPDAPAAKPNIEYEGDGRAFYWTNQYGGWTKQYDPSSDRADKAVGYRAPSAASQAPQQAQTYTDTNGTIVGIDPVTGAERFRIAGADFAKISPQEQEKIRQGDLEAVRTFNAQQAALDRAQQQKQLDETIANNRVQAAQADANLKFNQDKFAVESTQKNQEDIWNAQRDIQQINYQYAGLQQQAAQFNAQQAMSADIENQRRIEAQATRKAQLATDIGTTAQDAGSRGKLAATLLANPGMGQLDTALAGGKDFFTDESLVPLTDLLGQRADAAKAPNFLTPERVTAPTAPSLTVPNFGQAPTPAAKTPAPNDSTYYIGGVAQANNPFGASPTGSWNSATPEQFQHMADIAAQSQGTTAIDSATGQPSAPAASAPAPAYDANGGVNASGGFDLSQYFKADGGLAESAYIGDEEGPELHIPTIINGKPAAYVIPHDKLKSFLRMASQPQGKQQGGQTPTAADMVGMGMKALADGGLFSEGSIFGDAQINDQTQTRNFLAEALKRGLSGTPWQGLGRAPTPVEVSAPGTDQTVQQLGSSLSALGTGTPQDLFLRRANNLAPTGLYESAYRPINVRRTA